MKCTPNVRQKTTFGGALFMAKSTYEQRLKAVLDVIEKHISCKSAGKLMGFADETVRGWVKLYETFGVEGLTLKHGTYSGEFKQHVVEYMHENHLSVFETSVLFGIPSKTTPNSFIIKSHQPSY
jgi:transposase